MKRTHSLLVLLLAASTLLNGEAAFDVFERKCTQTPTFRSLYQRNKLDKSTGALLNSQRYQRYKMVSLETFDATLTKFFKTMQNCLAKEDHWFRTIRHLEHLLDPSCKTFFPYAQKVLVSPQTKVILKGDLHGDIHSLCAFIQSLSSQGLTKKNNPLVIIDPQVRIIFLGDYVDRGLWGTEVLYLLMLLKINNPDQVFLVRGNHEDVSIAARYGFRHEFFNKYRNHQLEDVEECYTKLAKLYEYLPVVIYLGSGELGTLAHISNNKISHINSSEAPLKKRKQESDHDTIEDAGYRLPSIDFIQCCHGGIEFGYNPQEFFKSNCSFEWLQTINRLTECTKYYSNCCVEDYNGKEQQLLSYCSNFTPVSPTHPSLLGFLWHDFMVNPYQTTHYKNGRGFCCDRELTCSTLLAASTAHHRLVAVIRAHQHVADNNDPLMKLMLSSGGCAQIWHATPGKMSWGSVFTLLLSPDSLAGVPRGDGRVFTGFSYDTSMLIQTASKLDDWKVTIINNEIYQA